jgi:O-antigen/teichoic acid export membrane protein
MREIWAKTARTAAAQLYSMVIGILSLSLTARMLGPEGRGQVAAILSWVALFSTIGHLSLGLVGTSRIATRKDSVWFGELLGSLLCIAAALSVIAWAIALSLQLGPREGIFSGLPVFPLVVGFSMLPWFILESYGTSLLIAKEGVDIHSKALVFARSISVLALYIMLGMLAWGVTGAVLAATLSPIIVSMVGIGYLIKTNEGKICFSWRETRALLVGGAKLHVNAVGTFLFSMSTGVLIINHYRGAVEAGYFQVAAQLFGVIMILPQAVSMVVYGKVTSLGPDDAWPLNRSILKRAMLATLIGGAVAWVAAPWLIRVVAGSEFEPSAEVFRWLLPALLGTTLSAAMAPQWIGRGMFVQASALTMTVGIVSLCVSLHLAEKLGMYGAVYASLAAYGIGASINLAFYIYCNRRTSKRNLGINENTAGK